MLVPGQPTSNTRRRLFPLVVAIGSGFLAPGGLAASENPERQAEADRTITLLLNDGRQATGELDARTDSRTLWIYSSADSIELDSGFGWERVRGVKHRGHWLTTSECQRLVADVKSAAAAQPGDNRAVSGPIGTDTSSVGAVPYAAAHPSVVAALHIEAVLANWDADAEPDGLRVFVRPQSIEGHHVPVNAQIEFELTAETQFRRGGRHDVRAEPLWQNLGRWSRRLHRSASGPEGSFCLLELPAPVVLDQADIATWGVLSARLGIPGEGAFDATVDVWLRP